jgi:hypothetical protein
MKYVSARMFVDMDELARQTQVAVVRDISSLIHAATDLVPGPGNNDFGTDDCDAPLTDPPLTKHKKRPNLCRLINNPFTFGQTYTCTLSAASVAVLHPVTIPISLSGDSIPLTINLIPLSAPFQSLSFLTGTCSINGNFCDDAGNSPCPTGQACLRDFIPLTVASSSALTSTIPVAPPAQFVLNLLQVDGWCDCKGYSEPCEPEVCVDHIAGAGNDCGSAATSTTPESCVCSVGASGPCTTAGCLACVRPDDGGPCHSGTQNTAPVTEWSGTSNASTCVLLATVQSPPAAPTTIYFTTGTAKATIADFAAVQGACSLSMMNCITDADCGGVQTCGGNVVTDFSRTATGNGVSCAALEAGNLSGLKFVGHSIQLDHVVNLNGLGDTITEFTLECN